MRIWYQGLSSPERWGAYYKYMEEYVHKVADPGTEIVFHGTPTGGMGGQYRSFEFLNARWLIGNAIKAEQSGFDAFAISNTLDFGMTESRELVNIPVVGILQTALQIASTMGRNFSLLVPNPKIMPMYEERVAMYGYKDRLVSMEPLEMQIRELHRILQDKEYRERCLQQFMECSKKAIDAGAEVIIPLGGPLVLFAIKNEIREIDDVPVFDATAAIIKMTEMVVKLRQITGVHISRRLMYKSPPADLLQEFGKAYGLL